MSCVCVCECEGGERERRDSVQGRAKYGVLVTSAD